MLDHRPQTRRIRVGREGAIYERVINKQINTLEGQFDIKPNEEKEEEEEERKINTHKTQTFSPSTTVFSISLLSSSSGSTVFHTIIAGHCTSATPCLTGTLGATEKTNVLASTSRNPFGSSTTVTPILPRNSLSMESYTGSWV